MKIMQSQKHTLYKVTADGRVYKWSIETGEDSITMQYGLIDGLQQSKTEYIEVNKSGRTIQEQVVLRMQSRINKCFDKGYHLTVDAALANIGTNAMSLPRPMLAQKARDVKHIDYKNAFYQKKYNGNRCLITNTGDGLLAYSRNGKAISTVNHILKGLNIEPGETLDGELYIHGHPLQDLGSLIRRKQPDNVLLQYVIYDIISDDPYKDRLEQLHRLSLGEGVSIAPTEVWTPGTNRKEVLDASIADGYEGIMIRQGDKGYEPGKRSNSLLKDKKPLDKEFLVVAVEPSKDGWGILMCMVDKDTYFKVSAPGTIENKYEIYKNRNSYIGKYVNVEFYEWTKDGVPFHPVAIYFREVE